MKRFFTLFSGLLLAAVIGLAQGKWEQSGVSQYGTGGINRSGERIDNSYNAGKFNSEVKSTAKNNPYVYFRKGQFSVPAKTYNPGATVTVSMNVSVKRHSGSGTPKGSAGAGLVNGKAGQGTTVPLSITVSGTDTSKSGTASMTVPSHSAAGNNFSIVYSCFDIKVVYLYRWVEDKTEVADTPVTTVVDTPVVAEDPVVPETVPEAVPATDALVMPDNTILPPEDTVAYEPGAEESDELESLPGIVSMDDPDDAKPLKGGDKKAAKARKALKDVDTDTVLSLPGFDLTKKDLIMYGIIGGLGLLVLILLLVLIFRKNPAKKAAKEEAKRAAAEAKAAAKAEAAEKAAAAKAAAAEKAAAAKAEREAKLAEQKAAQEAKQAEQKAAQEAAKAAAAKAEREAKLAEQKAAQEAKLAEQKAKQAELKAAQEAKLAEQKKNQEAAKAEREARLAEQKAKQEELKAAREAKLAEQKAAQEAKMAELKAKKEAAAAAAAAKAAEAKAPAAEKPAEKPAEEPKPAGKRFCENCGAPLAPDAVFCENCGTKVS